MIFFRMTSILFYRTAKLILFIFLVSGCSGKNEIMFNINEKFEKINSIILDNDEMPIFVFTEFGFYTVESGFSRISKYSNSTGFEFSFGTKGKGPGEFELGIPIYYSEDDKMVGIFDALNYKMLYFNDKGFFSHNEVFNISGKPIFSLVKQGINFNSYIQIALNNSRDSFNAIFSINEEKILEKGVALNKDYGFDSFYKYASNKNNVYILDIEENDFDIITYNTDTLEMNKLFIDKNIINKKYIKDINTIYSIDDIIIISNFGKSKNSIFYVFNLKGTYLGLFNIHSQQAIVGTYNNLLYIYSENNNQLIEIYQVK